MYESLSGLDGESEEERLLNRAINTSETNGKRPVGCRAPAWVFSKYTIGLLQSSLL
jgi:hypothetical protein